MATVLRGTLLRSRVKTFGHAQTWRWAALDLYGVQHVVLLEHEVLNDMLYQQLGQILHLMLNLPQLYGVGSWAV